MRGSQASVSISFAFQLFLIKLLILVIVMIGGLLKMVGYAILFKPPLFESLCFRGVKIHLSSLFGAAP